MNKKIFFFSLNFIFLCFSQTLLLQANEEKPADQEFSEELLNKDAKEILLRHVKKIEQERDQYKNERDAAIHKLAQSEAQIIIEKSRSYVPYNRVNVGLICAAVACGVPVTIWAIGELVNAWRGN